MRFFEAKEYGLQDVGNPLFPRKVTSLRLWILFGAVLSIGAITTALGVLVYGPYFDLEGIEIKGAVTLSADDMSNDVRQQFSDKNFLILPNRHQWFFNVQKAEERLLETFPLKSVEIQKDHATLRVTIVEDVFMVAFRSGEEFYFLDPEGFISRVAEPAEKAAILVKIGAVPDPGAGQEGMAVLQDNMPVIREKTATSHELGERIFSELVMQGMIDFNEGLKTAGVGTKEFVSDEIGLPWFSVTSDRPYLILFDATEDIATQLTVLKTVSDEYTDTEDTPRYIDVRFGTRVFIR